MNLLMSKESLELVRNEEKLPNKSRRKRKVVLPNGNEFLENVRE